MANPSLQIGNSKWAIKEDNLLGYSTAGTRFLPIPITMTRASAGTRVNPQGLVETVELLGSEDVVNGDFATDSDWTKGGLATISSGEANFIDAGSNTYSYIRQNISQTSGKNYILEFEVKNYVSGAVQVLLQGVSSVGSYNSNGIYSVVILSGTTNGYVELSRSYSGGTFSFSIDNVSVKEYQANDLARVDYTGSTSSLLAEPQRTNLITYSSEYTAVNGWDITGAIITTNQAISPDGTLTADLVELDTSTDRFAEIINSASGGTYTFSFYVKAKAGESGNWTSYCVGDTSASIVTFIDDSAWVRVSKTFTKTGAGNLIVYPAYRLNSNTVFDAYIWGAQLEEGSYATSYIPTSGSTVTRVQDQYSKTGISDKINSEEGVLFVEYAAFTSSGAKLLSLTDGGGIANGRIAIYYDGGGRIVGQLYDGATSYNLTFTPSDTTVFSKVAFKYKSGDLSLWVNGVEEATSSAIASINANTLSTIDFNDGTSSNGFYGKVKQLQIFKTALDDTQLQTLTT